jgi:hypothetical protein
MKKMLPVFALFLLPSLAFSCSCLYGLSFCELITPSSNVANVRIINTYVVATQFSEVLWLDVVVEEALQGSIEHDTMSILASYGTSCDPDFSAFHAGDNLIVQDEELANGPTDWYKFEFDNACKQSFLSLKNDTVSGFILDKYEMQPYGEFKSALGTCANFTHTFDKEELEGFIHLVPVPAATEAVVHTNVPLDYQLTLFTPTGQLMLQASVSGEHAHSLDVSDLPNGLYFVRLQIGEVPIVRRLVVQH